MLALLCHSDRSKGQQPPSHRKLHSIAPASNRVPGLGRTEMWVARMGKFSASPRGPKLAVYIDGRLCALQGSTGRLNQWAGSCDYREIPGRRASHTGNLPFWLGLPNRWLGTSLEGPRKWPGCFALSATITKPHDKWRPVSSLLFSRAPQKDITIHSPAGPEPPCPHPLPSPQVRSSPERDWSQEWQVSSWSWGERKDGQWD